MGMMRLLGVSDIYSAHVSSSDVETLSKKVSFIKAKTNLCHYSVLLFST